MGVVNVGVATTATASLLFLWVLLGAEVVLLCFL